MTNCMRPLQQSRKSPEQNAFFVQEWCSVSVGDGACAGTGLILVDPGVKINESVIVAFAATTCYLSYVYNMKPLAISANSAPV